MGNITREGGRAGAKHTARKIHNKSTIMDCKLFSQSDCRELPYFPRPPGTTRIVPEILLLPTTILFCKLFSQYFGYNGTIFFDSECNNALTNALSFVAGFITRNWIRHQERNIFPEPGGRVLRVSGQRIYRCLTII